MESTTILIRGGTMSEEANTSNTDEIRTALKSVNQAQLATVDAARGPLWLTALGTVMLAISLRGAWFADGEGSAEAVTGLAALAFLGLWVFYLVWLNRKGLKIRLIPSSGTGKLFLLGQVVFMLSVIALTGWLVDKGHDWVAWISTAVICVTFAVLVHRFPTGEPIRRKGLE
jgi:hypothetical protein